MTRRVVVFHSGDGSIYVTDEFNGDKSELETIGSSDYCERDWHEIMLMFTEYPNYLDFIKANYSAQECYHSHLSHEQEILPPRKISQDELYKLEDAYGENLLHVYDGVWGE